MKKAAYALLDAKLQSLPEERCARLLNFLPSQALEALKENASSQKGIDPEDFSSDSLLSSVHYSWFLPTLKTYSEEEISLFLSVLGTSSAKHLEKQLAISFTPKDLKDSAKKFLRCILQVSILGDEEDLLPQKYLPKSGLNILATFDKRKLVEVIDYLSLYDLAREIRQIVEPKVLKMIDSSLSEKHKKFLQSILPKKERIPFQKMGLASWEGSVQTLKNLLHKRGIQRLAIALQSAHPDLTWYVSHRLDIGRGGALLKIEEKKVMADVTDVMVDCVIEVLEELE